MHITEYEDKDRQIWDFDESGLRVVKGEDGYDYKLNPSINTRTKINKLMRIRLKIDELCHRLIDCKNRGVFRQLGTYENDMIDVFLQIHTNFYLLSEIPKGTIFDGLNKPKIRYVDEGLPFVGKDANERASYRDIFLNLNKTDNTLDDLVIHELAHSMANHVRYRPNDHHEDFKFCEDLIRELY